MPIVTKCTYPFNIVALAGSHTLQVYAIIMNHSIHSYGMDGNLNNLNDIYIASDRTESITVMYCEMSDSNPLKLFR